MPRPTLLAALTISVATASLAGCQVPTEQAAQTNCSALVAEAADAVDVDTQIRLLDQALVVCRSFDGLVAEINANPGVIGYSPEDFIANRCATIDIAVATKAPACDLVAPTTTTLAKVTMPPPTYEGETLDGRTVVLSPSDTVQFVGDLPKEISLTLDAYFEVGCDALVPRRDQLVAQAEAGGDAISVYAQHADHLVDYRNC